MNDARGHRTLRVSTAHGESGDLRRESQFVFAYQTDNPDCGISLLMPPNSVPYSANILPGVLRQNLPEGYLLDLIRASLGNTMKADDFNILAVTGSQTIGRVRAHADDAPKMRQQSEDLKTLLAWNEPEDVFEYLAAKYALASGISGVQPKVLTIARSDDEVVEKGAMKDRNLIIKASGADYPGLAENEYHCMTIGRQAGLKVPTFWLSDNREIFVVERFDIDRVNGDYLGFEDMTALTGKQNKDKYESSYETVAKAIGIFASAAHKTESLTEFFKSLVLSILVRNGDAHLKNFGLLYATPRSGDIRLSPLYDIVNTTAYLPKDAMALKMNKSKAWPTREQLLEFGKVHCRLDRPAAIVDDLIDVAISYRPEISAGEIWQSVSEQIKKGASSVRSARTFGGVI